MTDYWKHLGKGLQTFMGSNKDAVKIQQNGVFVVINDANDYSYNSITVDTNNVTAQESLISKYSDIPIFIYVSSQSINAFNLWYRNANLVPRGKTTVLRKIGRPSIPFSTPKIDLNIVLAESKSHMQDFINLEVVGKQSPKNLYKVFNENFLKNYNMKTFIAYHKDIPVAKMTAVIDGDVATLWGMKTNPQYEQLGAMVLLGEHIINHNVDNFKVKEHYFIPFAAPVYQSSINRGAQAIEEVYLFSSEVNN